MAVGDFLTWAVQAQDAPAHVARILQTILLNEGVVDKAGGSFQVQEGTGADMNITVGSGVLGDLAAVTGDDVAGQGVYVHEAQNGTVTRAIAASDPSQDRIDLVVLQNYDDEADSSGLNDAEVEVIQGTPAASPAAPALPSSAISLAEVLVGAGVTSITNANITDTRTEAPLRSDALEASVGQWQTWTPTLSSITVNDGIQVARYTQIGNTVHAYWSLDFGPSTTIGSNHSISLPVAAAWPANDLVEDNVVGVGNLTDKGTASYFATVRLNSSTTVRLRHQTVSGSLLPYGSISSTSPFTWTTDDRIAFSVTYEAA